MVKAKGRNHPYLKLEGEALDNHMMAMHGWSMQMVAVKGTQTLAQEYNYIGDMHRKERHLPPHESPNVQVLHPKPDQIGVCAAPWARNNRDSSSRPSGEVASLGRGPRVRGMRDVGKITQPQEMCMCQRHLGTFTATGVDVGGRHTFILRLPGLSQ